MDEPIEINLFGIGNHLMGICLFELGIIGRSEIVGVY
jgi:hypothetical protein